MKKLSRKLLTSITAVVVAIVAVAGSAFAWFTLANTANAEMEFTVVSGDGLEMAYLEGSHVAGDFDGDSNWKSTQKIGLEVQKAFGLVTSTDGVNFKGIDVDGQTYEMVDDVTGKYFEVTFAFRTQDAKIIANDETATQLSLVAPTKVEGKNGGTAQNAVRVSFTHTSTTIWEPSVGLGSYGNNNVATTNGGEDSTAESAYVSNPAWKKFVNTVVGDSGDYEEDGVTKVRDERVEELSIYLDEKPKQENLVKNADGTALTSLNTGNINKLVWALNEDDGYYYAAVTVRIWLEGFDGDAYNEIYKQSFSVSLVFEKVAKT